MAHILVVDDEPTVLETVSQILEEAGHYVTRTTSGHDALVLIQQQPPELIILDIIMPEMNGLDLCQRLRGDPFTAKLPILFLTAKGQPGDIARGLNIGGDDYLTKPFEVVELPARVAAILRRSSGGSLDMQASNLVVGSLRLNLTRPEVQHEDRLIELRSTEYRLLHYLMQHAGHPVSTEQLLEHVWDYPPGTGDPALVYVHIGNLRTKLERDPQVPSLLRNVRGRGYLIPAAN
jgi:DNA-binding response OmpR family regulator